MKKMLRVPFAVSLLVVSMPVMAMALTVNKVNVPQDQVDMIASAYVAQGATDNADFRKSLTNEVATREVLAQEAVKLGLDKKPEGQAMLANVRRDALVQLYRTDYIRTHPVTEAETRSLYDQQKQEAGTTEYHLSHILVKSEDDAKAIEAALKKGTKFETLVKDKSLDQQSKAHGGDIGWHVPAALNPTLRQAVSKLSKGQVSDPVQSEYGWHIIKLVDTRPYEFPAYDKIKPMLQQQLQTANLMKAIEELRKKADVKF